jgi:hypothetical protein
MTFFVKNIIGNALLPLKQKKTINIFGHTEPTFLRKKDLFIKKIENIIHHVQISFFLDSI